MAASWFPRGAGEPILLNGVVLSRETRSVDAASATPHGVNFGAHRPSIDGRDGLVASGHALASQAGVRTMQAGGNAVDAAIACAAAVGVVEPAMSGAGGDGMILIYDAATRRVYGVNATGPAPAGASRELYLARGGIPLRGMLSVSVPGLVDGWLLAHGRFGKLSLAEVLAPAIDLCERGFPVSRKLAAALAREHAALAADPATRAVFAPRGRPLQAGERLLQRDLGTTLRRIAEQGRAALYEGEIARQIADCSRAQGGVLDEHDLAAYHARWEEPIQVDYQGHRVYEMPPNSSGHVLLQALNLIEPFDLAAMGCLSPDSVHVMVEALRLAFADREAFMADPDWVEVPLKRLLSKAYARERAAAIDLARTNPAVGPGAAQQAGDTTCLCTADGAGNAVCLLQSLQMAFGSCLIAGGTGILLNNRMTYWHLEPGHPNVLAPGKRVRHTMNPVIATRNGRPVIVCGTPGADTQVQTNLQLLTHAIHFGMTPQEAVEAPRWRSLQNPMESTVPHTCDDRLQLETRFPPEVRAALQHKGHAIETVGAWGAMGNAQFIRIDPDSGALLGGSDPRRDGYAIGY